MNNVAQPLIQASLIGEAIDAGPALIFVADEEMRYVAVNDYACKVLGYTREELLRLSVTDVAADDGAEQEYAGMVAAGERAGRARVMRKDGSLLELEYRACETRVALMTLYVSVGFPV